MQQYIVRRLLAAIPTLFLLSLLIFSLIRLAPGDAVIAQIGDVSYILIRHPWDVKPALERSVSSLSEALDEAHTQGLFPSKELQAVERRMSRAKGDLDRLYVPLRGSPEAQGFDQPRAIRRLEVIRRELLRVWSGLDATKAPSIQRPLAAARTELNLALQPLEAIRHDLGLDRPYLSQYVSWIGGFFTGDVPESLRSHRSVLSEVGRTLPVTAELALLAIIVATVIALPIGIYSAIRQDTIPDYLGRIFALTGLSIPDFWLGTIVLVSLAIWVGWIPPVTYHTFLESPWDNIKQMFIPALILGFRFSAVAMRMVRSSLLEVLREDYIRTAWAKGLRERLVVQRHALKNASIPVITIMGAQVGYLLGGSVVIETIYGLPGLGRLTVDSLVQRDYPQIQTNVLFIGVVMISANLLVDLSYSWLDPRVRYA